MRLSLSSLFHLKADPPKRIQLSYIHPLSGSSINQGRSTLITGENRHRHCTQINFVTSRHNFHLFFYGSFMVFLRFYFYFWREDGKKKVRERNINVKERHGGLS